MSAALIGPPEDNMQDFWNTWYAAAAPHPDGFFFTRMIRWPEGTSLVYQSFAYPQVFAVAAMAALVGHDATTLLFLQNLTLLASFPLAALGAYALTRYLTRSTVGGTAAGFVFAFNPWHVAQAMHHAHVASIEFIPFFVLAYLKAAERKSIVWLVAAIVFYALSALSCWYYLFYIAYFIAFHTIYCAVYTRAWPRGWTLLTPAACLAGTVVLLSPLLVPMMTLAAHAPVYNIGTDGYVADLTAFLAFPPTHVLSALGKGIYTLITGNAWEGTIYLGIVNVAIAVAAWFTVRRHPGQRALLAYALGGVAVFAVIACGDTLHVLGRDTIALPGWLLSRLPFFANVRTPSRAMVFVYLFLGVAVGYGVTLAWRSRRIWWRMILFWTATLAVADFWPVALAATPVACSPAYALIRADADGSFAVLDLPRGYIEGNASELAQICHGGPIVQGSVTRDLGPTLISRLETRDLAAQKRQLAAARVKYIVIHRPADGVFQWSDKDGARDAYFHTYRPVYNDASISVLKVY